MNRRKDLSLFSAINCVRVRTDHDTENESGERRMKMESGNKKRDL